MNRFFTGGIALLAATVMAAAAPVALAADSQEKTLHRNRFLEAELSLATKNRFYMVFDLDRKEIQLKARGSVFRAWPILNYQQIGAEVPIEVLSLQKRTYAAQELRVRITPADGDKEEVHEPSPVKKKKLAQLAKNPADPNAPQNVTAPKWDAMELKDMPTDYFLNFSKEVLINVDSDEEAKDEGIGRKLKKIFEEIKKNYALYRKKKEPGEGVTINLKLKPGDAQALYWALGDSMNIIFWAAVK